MADTESFGVIVYLGQGTSPETYRPIVGVLEVSDMFQFDRSLIDVSKLADTVKEYLAGQADPGAVNFSLAFDMGEQTHDESTGLLSKLLVRGRHNFVVKYPESTASGSAAEYQYFEGIVTNINPHAQQDDIIRADCSIKISGLPTWSATAPTLAS